MQGGREERGGEDGRGKEEILRERGRGMGRGKGRKRGIGMGGEGKGQRVWPPPPFANFWIRP